MSGYAKVHGSILRSTVWVGQSKETRLTWVTLLILADGDGYVASSVPGLAKEAGVTLEECEAALDIFRAPDAYSRTKEYEGRRVVDVDGGWVVLNHRKYRDYKTFEQVKNAERQARFKAKHRAVRGVTADVSNVTGNARAKPKPRKGKADAAALPVTQVTGSHVICPDPSLEDPDHSDPDPRIPSDPAKDRPAREALPSGVFDAPVLQGVASMTFVVPASWTGPTQQHIDFCAEFRLDVADEAARFRLTHFQKAFPATPDGVDKRFMLWLREGRVRAETERGKQLAHGGAAAVGPRRGRMPTNGVHQLQPDEGRTGFESLDLPQPEPERPRRATRR
jgi:hypothetical protein